MKVPKISVSGFFFYLMAVCITLYNLVNMECARKIRFNYNCYN